MWKDWNEGAVRNDFRLMREIGMKTVRVFPSWRDFQPIELFCSGGNLPKEVRMFGKTLPDTEIGRAGIDEVMIRRFRRMTEIAEENGLELIVALITGAMSGLMLAPPALARLNFFTDPFALKWEVRFVRTMVRELKDCSSIVMWELGNECSNLSYGSRDDGWIWTALIASAIRSEDPIRPVSSGLHGLLPANDTEFTEPQDLWTIQGQSENCDYLTAHPYPFSVSKAPARMDGFRAMRTAFQATVECRFYGDLGGKPGFAEEVGAFGAGACSNETKALFLRNCMFNCWAHGSEYFLWWCGFEHSILPYPPYDWSTMERELGLFDEVLKPRPIGEEMLKFSRFIDALPFKELPPFRKEALCLLTRGQNYEECLCNEWSTFMLAKHCGFDIGFAFTGNNIPESDCYILPGISGDQWCFGTEYQVLLNRVREGATLYLSVGNGMPSMFREVFDCEVVEREARTVPARVSLGGNTFAIPAPYKMYLKPIGCEVLAVEDDGNPVMVRAHYGKGQVILLTLPLELHLGQTPAVFESDKLGPWRQFYLESFAGKLAADRRVHSLCPQLTLTEHDDPETGRSYAIAVNNTNGDLAGDMLTFAPGWRPAETPSAIPAHGGILITLEKC